MKTGKKLGLKKGDFIITGDGGFPAIVIGDVNTFAPTCEVWGFEQEIGSTYAETAKKISATAFFFQCLRFGHANPAARSKEGKAALEVAKAGAV